MNSKTLKVDKCSELIIEKFNSEYIDCDQTLFHENEIIGLFLKLSEFKKIKKIFNEVKKEILSKNKSIKSISEPIQATYYYDEWEGYWTEDQPGDYSWWKLKKNGYIRDFKICSFEIKGGYKLIKRN